MTSYYYVDGPARTVYLKIKCSTLCIIEDSCSTVVVHFTAGQHSTSLGFISPPNDLVKRSPVIMKQYQVQNTHVIGEPIYCWSADEHSPGPQCQCLENVRAKSHTPVHVHFTAPPDGLHHLGQGINLQEYVMQNILIMMFSCNIQA